jgi:hypothetical protein
VDPWSLGKAPPLCFPFPECILSSHKRDKDEKSSPSKFFRALQRNIRCFVKKESAVQLVARCVTPSGLGLVGSKALAVRRQSAGVAGMAGGLLAPARGAVRAGRWGPGGVSSAAAAAAAAAPTATTTAPKTKT